MYYTSRMKRGRPSGRKLSHSVTLRIDDDVMVALERMADAERRPVAAMARILLEEAMEARAGKRPAPSGSRPKK